MNLRKAKDDCFYASLQSVTPHLSLGGEVFWAGQHRKSGIGYAARYNTDKMVLLLFFFLEFCSMTRFKFDAYNHIVIPCNCICLITTGDANVCFTADFAFPFNSTF